MTIPNKWYISDCTSEVYPTSKMDAGTFYLPTNIQYNEEDKIYYYQEYQSTTKFQQRYPMHWQMSLTFTANSLASAFMSWKTVR